MNPWKRQHAPQVSGPDPGYDVTTGDPVYDQDLSATIENPSNLLLAPSALFVPVEQLGKPGVGPDNFQQFQSGVTNAIPDNPSAEQGMGRAPGWQWAHMPHVQQFNPARLAGAYMQDGGGFHAFSERVQRSPIWPEGYLNYAQHPNQHAVWPGIATINQPETPAFVESVPPIMPGGY